MWGAQAASRADGARRISRSGCLWFMAVGILNGGAVLLMYHALNLGTVSAVSPIVATYPIFTMLFSALFLKTETLSAKAVAGVFLAIAGVAVILTA
jgi:drug/metabolite transporter (DMT)-like permease